MERHTETTTIDTFFANLSLVATKRDLLEKQLIPIFGDVENYLNNCKARTWWPTWETKNGTIKPMGHGAVTKLINKGEASPIVVEAVRLYNNAKQKKASDKKDKEWSKMLEKAANIATEKGELGLFILALDELKGEVAKKNDEAVAELATATA